MSSTRTSLGVSSILPSEATTANEAYFRTEGVDESFKSREA